MKDAVRKTTQTLACIVVILFTGISAASAADSEPPPLPLHGIEGSGGIAATYSAYLTNPAEKGEIFGKPSFGTGLVTMESGKFLGFATITETFGNRLELGYGYDALYLDDLPDDIRSATGVDISDDFVYLHNFNARVALLKEGDFARAWVPAVTLGAHYKYNDTSDRIDRELGGALSGIGIADNDGMDYTLYASKKIGFLPRPLLVNAGLRSTRAAHIGVLGFTGDRDLVFEGSMVAFLTDRLALGVEYRQKPDDYDRINGLIGDEDDWWSVVAAYVVDDHLTISGGYFDLGTVLNHEENRSLGLKIKYEL
ncbi:MAG: DUF3034 family protein [Desulfobacteraceae bacterium]|nr:DUF3034 family protein [Desulfobacteraceae bacterium]